MAKVSFFQLEDFFFLRAVLNGISAQKAFVRYYAHLAYDANGEVLIPHGNQLNSMSRALIKGIDEAVRISTTVSNLAKKEATNLSDIMRKMDEQAERVARQPPGAAHGYSTPSPTFEELENQARLTFEDTPKDSAMTFEEWEATLPDGMYSESELPGLYLEYLEDQGDVGEAAKNEIAASITINKQLRALSILQSELVSRPAPAHKTSTWFAPLIVAKFASVGVLDIGSLWRFVSANGRHWFKRIPGIKETRGKRIESWLNFHSQTLGEINRSGANWRPKARLSALPRLQRPQRVNALTIDAASGSIEAPSPARGSREIAPLELMNVPPHLDGRNGLFRPEAPNHLGARNDMDAVFIWLNGYLNAGRAKTFDAYRREIERFYHWCITEAECPLSSVSVSHAQAYQKFLKSIPNKWIGNARVARGDPQWKPFRGQLSPKSQNYAVNVIRNLYSYLHKNGYITGNPFSGIIAITEDRPGRVLDATRSFNQQDLLLLQGALTTLPGLASTSPLKAAIARRKSLIMHLGLMTGMRISEMAGATLKSLRHPIVDNEVGQDWIIDVVGKRGKIREIPISENLHQMILMHHNDWLALTPFADKRREGFKFAPPLIAALESPVPEGDPSGKRLKTALLSPFDDMDEGSKDSPAGSSLQHRQITDQSVLASDNAALSANGIYRTMKAFLRYAEGLTEDQAQKERLTEASTHWMRHTFAHEILRTNDNDQGLANAQALLGHASIATTGQYVKQDISSKVKAARKVSPLGL
jgi:site-specific recombinase XerD